MKNFRKSRKALSPVVASIILIAVTVAVSIAVAAWMGALTVGFMDTEELKIINVDFTGTDETNKVVTVTARNTGSGAVTVEDVYISGDLQTPTLAPESGAVNANGDLTATMSYNWQEGTSYQIKMMTSKGNPFVFTATAPT